MNFSLVTLATLVGTSAAFMAPQTTHGMAPLRMSDVAVENVMENEEPTPPQLPEMSQSMPFLKRPSALTGALAGDVGFDPFGFAKNEVDLNNYREAEVKHARLAMLAAAGWPLSELFDKKIATVLNMSTLLDSNDRVPSLLNGGLGQISPLYWMLCLGGAAAIEFFSMNKAQLKGDSYFPGNLGFDPIGMYPKDEAGQQRMQLAEIKNGRLAMIAISAFAFQEFVSNVGVVDETPLFFHPISVAFKMATNNGYIQ